MSKRNYETAFLSDVSKNEYTRENSLSLWKDSKYSNAYDPNLIREWKVSQSLTKYYVQIKSLEYMGMKSNAYLRVGDIVLYVKHPSFVKNEEGFICTIPKLNHFLFMKGKEENGKIFDDTKKEEEEQKNKVKIDRIFGEQFSLSGDLAFDEEKMKTFLFENVEQVFNDTKNIVDGSDDTKEGYFETLNKHKRLLEIRKQYLKLEEQKKYLVKNNTLYLFTNGPSLEERIRFLGVATTPYVMTQKNPYRGASNLLERQISTVLANIQNGGKQNCYCPAKRIFEHGNLVLYFREMVYEEKNLDGVTINKFPYMQAYIECLRSNDVVSKKYIDFHNQFRIANPIVLGVVSKVLRKIEYEKDDEQKDINRIENFWNHYMEKMDKQNCYMNIDSISYDKYLQ